MANDKLGLPTKERNALLRNQVSNLLWYGKIETTLAKAKSVRSKAEKILTLAINSYDDTVKAVKTITDSKGAKVKQEVINDGPKDLLQEEKLCLMFTTFKNKERKRKALQLLKLEQKALTTHL